MMRFFLDTEFVADGTSLDLLSVGVVSQHGHEYYGENKECDLSRASEWVRANVLPHLDLSAGESVWNNFNRKSRAVIVEDLVAFVERTNDGSPVEFWGWCCGLDYAALCLLFGLDNWPSSWGYYFHDIQALADENGIDLSERDQDEQPDQHNALADARWIKRLYEQMALSRPTMPQEPRSCP